MEKKGILTQHYALFLFSYQIPTLTKLMGKAILTSGFSIQTCISNHYNMFSIENLLNQIFIVTLYHVYDFTELYFIS